MWSESWQSQGSSNPWDFWGIWSASPATRWFREGPSPGGQWVDALSPGKKKLKHLIPRRDSWVEIKGAKWSWPDAWTLQVSLCNIIVFMKTKDLLHDFIFTMSILYLGILGRHQIWMLCQNGVTGWLLSTCKEHKPRKGQGGSGQIKEKVSNLSGLTQYFTRHSLTPYHLHSKTRQRLTGNKIVLKM